MKLKVLLLVLVFVVSLPVLAQEVYPTPGAPDTLALDYTAWITPKQAAPGANPCDDLSGPCNFGEGVAADVTVTLNAGEGITCSGDYLDVWTLDGKNSVFFVSDEISTNETVIGAFSNKDGFQAIIHVPSGAYCEPVRHVFKGTPWTMEEIAMAISLRIQRYTQNGDDPNRFVEQQATAWPNCESFEDIKDGPKGVDCTLTLVVAGLVNSDGTVQNLAGIYSEQGLPQVRDATGALAAGSLYYMDLNPTTTPVPGA